MLRFLLPALALLVIGIGGFVWWWDSGPSATSEVRAYVDATGRANVVDVRDCRHSKDPRPPEEYPEYAVFLCDVQSDRRIQLQFGRVIPRAHSFYCFRVPRAGPRPRPDYAASPYGQAARPDSCFPQTT